MFSFEDAHTLSFEEFHRTMANISLIRLVDPESQHVKDAVEEIVFNEQKSGRSTNLSPATIKVSVVVMYACCGLFGVHPTDIITYSTAIIKIKTRI